MCDESMWKISVGAVVLNSSDEILLVRPTYKPALDLPGGILEFGENPVEGLKRELWEELSVEVEVGDLLCVDFIPKDWEKCPVIMLIFKCEIKKGCPRVDMVEVDRAFFTSIPSALESVSLNMRRRLNRIFFEGGIFGVSEE